MSPSSHPAVQAAVRGARHLTSHEHLDTVTSTNDVALARVSPGPALGVSPETALGVSPETALGLVVSADRQTAGRGRRGRSWTDDVGGPEGPGNLAVSVVVPLPRDAPGLTPVAVGLAVAAAYEAAGASPALKWPNDVELGGRKAAGILVERHAVGGRDVVVIGCGLDLDWRGVSREGEAAAWTSLAEALGHGVDRGQVLADLLLALDAELSALADPAGLLARYRRRCSTLGRGVEVVLPDGAVLVGTAVDLDAEGLLIVEADGARTAVRAGDVRVRTTG